MPVRVLGKPLFFFSDGHLCPERGGRWVQRRRTERISIYILSGVKNEKVRNISNIHKNTSDQEDQTPLSDTQLFIFKKYIYI